MSLGIVGYPFSLVVIILPPNRTIEECPRASFTFISMSI